MRIHDQKRKAFHDLEKWKCDSTTIPVVLALHFFIKCKALLNSYIGKGEHFLQKQASCNSESIHPEGGKEGWAVCSVSLAQSRMMSVRLSHPTVDQERRLCKDFPHVSSVLGRVGAHYLTILVDFWGTYCPCSTHYETTVLKAEWGPQQVNQSKGTSIWVPVCLAQALHAVFKAPKQSKKLL